MVKNPPTQPRGDFLPQPRTREHRCDFAFETISVVPCQLSRRGARLDRDRWLRFIERFDEPGIQLLQVLIRRGRWLPYRVEAHCEIVDLQTEHLLGCQVSRFFPPGCPNT